MNVYQVNKETVIDKFVLENDDKLIVLTLGSSNKIEDQENITKLKKYIKHDLAPNNLSSIFLYVDLNTEYIATKHQYTKKVTKNNIPVGLFIYDKQVLAMVGSMDVESLKEAFNKIKTDISNIYDKQLEELKQQQLEIVKQKKLEKIQNIKNKLIVEELEKLKHLKELEENK